MKPTRARRKAEYLLIDISNSFTKLAFSSRARVERPERVPTPRLTAARLRVFLQRREVRAIVFSSVVPARDAIVRSAAGKREIVAVSAALDLGIGIDYPQPRSIGADRLANAVAVAELHGTPAIVVDFGTAVTFDIVSSGGAYLGGVIAPGLEAMTSYLHQRTALLPRLTLREPRRTVGRSTREAMMAGAVLGYRGLVREILARVREEAFPGQAPRVVATGGYARLIAAQVPAIEAVHPHLTLEGLRLIGNRSLRPRAASPDRPAGPAQKGKKARRAKPARATRKRA